MPIGELEISNAIEAGAEAALNAGLANNALANHAPPYEETPLQILCRDDAGRVIAGLTGKTFWNWLYIDILWVEKSLRGQGVGMSLVHAAEVEAARRGCHSAYLWTESFEGEDFYPKLGYEVFVRKNDFPVGHTRIGLQKKLKVAA